MSDVLIERRSISGGDSGYASGDHPPLRSGVARAAQGSIKTSSDSGSTRIDEAAERSGALARGSVEMSSRRAAVWVAVLLLATVAVRLIDPTGWLGSDDAGYYSAAEFVLSGEPITRLHHHYARMVMILPVAASMGLFGDSTAAAAAPTAVASAACVAAVALLGRMTWGWREGLLAGAVVSMLPYFRVLSTTTYPDVHVCLWTSTAMLLVLLGGRTARDRTRVMLYMAAGFAVGMAVSVKVFAATALSGVGVLIVDRERSRRGRILAAGSLTVGGLLFIVVEGAYQWGQTGDFLFSVHAHEQSREGTPGMHSEDDPQRIGVAAMAAERMSLMFRPWKSGWGVVGMLFWPATAAVLMTDRRGRWLAAWAMGTYLLIAFVPVSVADGYQPYPHFHGRHILPACVPFGLCLGWSVVRAAEWVRGKVPGRGFVSAGGGRWSRAADLRFAAVGLAAGGLSFVNPEELSGFRDRPTGRVGQGIVAIASRLDPDDDRPIFMSASAYWRYRMLFPESARGRLRIAVDEGAPDWWRQTVVDIERRAAALPPPGEALLIATPRQLGGEAEVWDYGVTLPRATLGAWREAPAPVAMVRGEDRAIVAVGAKKPPDGAVVMLLGDGS